MTLDDLLLKKFDLRTYNCWHLVRDAWMVLTGQELGLACMDRPTLEACQDVVGQWVGTKYVEIAKPPKAGPCVVLFERQGYRPHVGVFYRGKVLHIKAGGARRQLVQAAGFGFESTRFFLPCCTQS